MWSVFYSLEWFLSPAISNSHALRWIIAFPPSTSLLDSFQNPTNAGINVAKSELILKFYFISFCFALDLENYELREDENNWKIKWEIMETKKKRRESEVFGENTRIVVFYTSKYQHNQFTGTKKLSQWLEKILPDTQLLLMMEIRVVDCYSLYWGSSEWNDSAFKNVWIMTENFTSRRPRWAQETSSLVNLQSGTRNIRKATKNFSPHHSPLLFVIIKRINKKWKSFSFLFSLISVLFLFYCIKNFPQISAPLCSEEKWTSKAMKWDRKERRKVLITFHHRRRRCSHNETSKRTSLMEL